MIFGGKQSIVREVTETDLSKIQTLSLEDKERELSCMTSTLI